jgi:hypothetical protein
MDLGPCKFLNDCGDMEHCIGSASIGKGTCHYYCYLDQVNPAKPAAGLGGCPAGQKCQAVVDGASTDVGIPNIGLCATTGS